MNKKQKKMLIRIMVSAALLIGFNFLPFEGVLRFILYLIPYLVIGYDILIKAFKGIKNRQPFDESLLMAIATIGAIAIAIYTEVAEHEAGDYVEAIAVMLFYQIGEWFQSYAVGKSRRNISDLMDIRPDYANIEKDGKLEQIDPDEVEPGSVIVVQPGEKVPIDGIVIEGTSTINTSALTGESLPRDAQEGDEIISGCINMTGVLKIKTTKEFGESTVSKILDLVENASSRKSKSEDFITKFARIYTPAVVYSAIALAILPPLVRMFGMGIPAEWGTWIYRALTFLVISCPCALVISIPLSFFAGIGGASNAGVLVKGSNYLETLSQTKCVVDGIDVAAGNSKLMDRLGVKWIDCHQSGTIIHMAVDGRYAGHIVISDIEKPHAKEAIQALKKAGVEKTVMLTGDSRRVAEHVAADLGIDEVHAELLPADKVSEVEEILKKNTGKGKLAFVGDGINDAPVLSRADIGIAMGAMGSDAAIEAADIVLMDDDPLKISKAIRISRKCLRIVYENIWFAIGIKLICLVLGAVGIANMWLAIFADVGVMIIAVLNAIRALFVKKL